MCLERTSVGNKTRAPFVRVLCVVGVIVPVYVVYFVCGRLWVYIVAGAVWYILCGVIYCA